MVTGNHHKHAILVGGGSGVSKLHFFIFFNPSHRKEHSTNTDLAKDDLLLHHQAPHTGDFLGVGDRADSNLALNCEAIANILFLKLRLSLRTDKEPDKLVFVFYVMSCFSLAS